MRTVSAKPASGKAASPKVASAHAHYAAGVIHELHGETDLALEDFQRAAVEDPDDGTLMLEVSRRFLQYQKPEKALELLQAATARGNAGGEIFARLGSVYTRLGRNEDALAANQIAIKKSPRSLTGYQNLFLNLLQAKRATEALNLLDEAGRLGSVGADFLIGLADFYQNYLQQFPTQREAVRGKALEVLIRAEALNPTDPQTRLRLADGLYALGEVKRATQLYLPLLEQIGDLPLVRDNVRSKLADIYLRGDNHQAARAQLEAIVRDDPSNAQAHYFLGSLAYDDKRWADAVGHFQKTLLFNPNFEPAYYDLAAAQLAAADAAGALLTLQQARGKFPQNFPGEYLTALAEGRQKNFAEAIKRFTSAEVIARAGEPKRLTAEFYFEAGIAFERNGDRAGAEQYFERALELKPEFPEAQNYLGYMWAERGEKLDRARGLIEKALKAEPKSAAYLDSMGWVLFKLNQPKAALNYLLQAVALNGEPDATLYDHLGDIYSALREADKAHEAWRKSLAVEASDLVRQKLNPPKTP
jgi:tetratricopeptide (TPR) repeat protein